LEFICLPATGMISTLAGKYLVLGIWNYF